MSKRRLPIAFGLIIASFAISHISFLTFPNLMKSLNFRLVDHLFRLRASLKDFRPVYDETVVHLNIDDTTVATLGTTIPSRSDLARVIENLGKMGVAAQVYDFVLPSPAIPEEDAELVRATESAGNVYFGMIFRSISDDQEPHDSKRETAGDPELLARTGWDVRVEGIAGPTLTGMNPQFNFAALSRSVRGMGFLNAEAEEDGYYRRIPLLLKSGEAYYPSLALRVICDYLGVPPERVFVRPGRSVTLSGVGGRGDPATGDIVVPVDRENHLLINYIGPWEGMKHYHFSRIWEAADDLDELELWADELAGKIVLVSDVSTGAGDIGPVPVDERFPKVGLHANVMNSILTRSFVQELPAGGMLLVELTLFVALFYLSVRSSSLVFSLGSTAIAATFLGGAVVAFLYAATVINPLRPTLATGLAMLSILAYRFLEEEKERLILRTSFEAYFPPSIVRKILSDPRSITSGGQRKVLTILFSDIKGFTTYCTRMSPDQIKSLLNEYFEAMTEIVFKYGGTIDKFIGDGLMVFFGDPESQPDHAVRAAKASMEMQHRVAQLRSAWRQRGDMPIEIRIGINTGLVVVGNMGSARRLSYTVLGAHVNLAQRLEANAPVGGVLVGEGTWNQIKDDIPARPMGNIRVKGIEEPVSVYELLLTDDRARQEPRADLAQDGA